MKMKFIVTALFLLASAQAFAGAANADLKCQGKTIKIDGNVPGDMGEWDVKVIRAGREARIFSLTNQQNGETEENSKMVVGDYLDDAVWTLNAERTGADYGFLDMHALPKTVKYERTRNGYRAKFQAKVRYSFTELTRENENETVACHLVYEI